MPARCGQAAGRLSHTTLGQGAGKGGIWPYQSHLRLYSFRRSMAAWWSSTSEAIKDLSFSALSRSNRSFSFSLTTWSTRSLESEINWVKGKLFLVDPKMLSSGLLQYKHKTKTTQHLPKQGHSIAPFKNLHAHLRSPSFLQQRDDSRWATSAYGKKKGMSQASPWLLLDI